MRKLVIILMALAVTAVSASAQSLLDNEFYRKAKLLQTQSQQAFDAGDYDTAAALAQQAQDNLAKSDEYVTRMTAYYTATGWLAKAKDQLTFAKSIKADVNYKDKYDTASKDITDAQTALDAAQYPESTQLSKDAIAALEGIQRQTAPSPVATTPAAPAEVFPSEYTVRLRLPLRDCLWRIAGFPFIYNNPWKWTVLYQANKSVLVNPNNPDLIEPGQVLKIPSIAGETREGMYDPARTYPAFGAKAQ